MGKNEEVKVPCKIMTRTCGYFANVDQMNKGKQEEVSQRKKYDANNRLSTLFKKIEV